MGREGSEFSDRYPQLRSYCLTEMTAFGTVTQVGKAFFLGVQPRPRPKGTWQQPAASPKFLVPYLRPNAFNQSKRIHIAPYVASESEAHVGLD